MHRKKWLVRNSLFISWLLSYASILLVPLLISGVIYYSTVNIVENETNRANSALLTQLQQTIDNEIKEIERMGIQIAFNQRVRAALSIKEFSSSDQFNLLKLKQDIQTYQSVNNILEYVYIYFKNSNSAIDNDIFIKNELFHEIKEQEIILDFEEWTGLMQKSHNKQYLIFENYFGENEKKRSIAYLQSLPILSSANHTATLVQMINEEALLHIIQDVPWVNKGMITILDSEDRIIIATQPVDLAESITYKDMVKDQDIIYLMISGKRHAVTYISSKINSWKYILLMPTNVFWEKVEHIQMLIYISIIICVVLGGIIAFIFTKRNYNPIHKIVQSLIKKDILSFESKYEEYGFIREAINDALTEKNEIAKTLKKQDDILKNNSFIRLIKSNDYTSEYARETFSAHGIDPENEYFSVVLFCIDESYMSSSDDNNKNPEEEMEIEKFVILNVVEEMVNRLYFGLMVDMGDMLACIICFKNKNKNDDCNAEVYRIVNDAKQFISKNLNIYFSAFSGSMHMGIKGIARSYKEALDANEAQIFAGSGGIIFYDDISGISGNYHYSVNIEHRLANLIETGDYDSAYNLLMEIFNKSFESESFSVEIAKCLMFDIAGTFIKVSDKISDVTFMEEIEPFKRLSECESVLNMKEEVVSMLKLLCEHSCKNAKETNNNLSSKVIDYINNNYHDINLNINMIAEMLDITPSYLSRQFKIQTKGKLLDAINRIRLEKSKQLLKEDKVNIKDISEMVGYSNSSVFIRAFKKYEGITPGQFKEITKNFGS